MYEKIKGISIYRKTGNSRNGVKVRNLETYKRLIDEDSNIDSNTRMLLENVFNKYEDGFAVVDNNLP